MSDWEREMELCRLFWRSIMPNVLTSDKHGNKYRADPNINSLLLYPPQSFLWRSVPVFPSSKFHCCCPSTEMVCGYPFHLGGDVANDPSSSLSPNSLHSSHDRPMARLQAHVTASQAAQLLELLSGLSQARCWSCGWYILWERRRIPQGRNTRRAGRGGHTEVRGEEAIRHILIEPGGLIEWGNHRECIINQSEDELNDRGLYRMDGAWFVAGRSNTIRSVNKLVPGLLVSLTSLWLFWSREVIAEAVQWKNEFRCEQLFVSSINLQLEAEGL